MTSAYGETEAKSVLTLCSEQCRVAPYQFEPTLNEPRTVTFDTDLTSSSDVDSSTSESSGTVSDTDSAQAGWESIIPPVEEWCRCGLMRADSNQERVRLLSLIRQGVKPIKR
ncbi:uncharacterized protein LOC143231397 [Tachypleus tridentatus]|uniref:uncharacterized protein LOC143231397 n=1 Tax=Tachypleus tridentatus TaxID=6853 RepID=UPI003FD5DC08